MARETLYNLFSYTFLLSFLLYLSIETIVLVTEIRILQIFQSDLLLVFSGIVLLISALLRPKSNRLESEYKQDEYSFSFKLLISLFVSILVFVLMFAANGLIGPAEFLLIVAFASIGGLVSFSVL